MYITLPILENDFQTLMIIFDNFTLDFTFIIDIVGNLADSLLISNTKCLFIMDATHRIISALYCN